jgi:hypothetical protein
MPWKCDACRRGLFRTVLFTVPVLAALAAGPAVSSALSGGDVAAPTVSPLVMTGDGAAEVPAATNADATSIWQNTVRQPYIPPTRSPYIPPGP